MWNGFGALAKFCVHCRFPLSVTRSQYCFLALCVWILILLTNTLMKTFGGLWNWLTWKTLCHRFLINLIMSVLKVERISGMSKNHAWEKLPQELNENWEGRVCPPTCNWTFCFWKPYSWILAIAVQWGAPPCPVREFGEGVGEFQRHDQAIRQLGFIQHVLNSSLGI